MKASTLSEPSKVQLAIELSGIERRSIDDSHQAKRPIDEAYSDPYCSDVLDLAFQAVLRAPSQPEFRELMQAGFNTGSPVAKGLATFGKRYMSVLEQLSTARNQYVRINVLAVGLLSVRDAEVGQPLRRRAMEIAARGLADESIEVRAATAYLLADTPGTDSIALLQDAQSNIRNGKLRP